MGIFQDAYPENRTAPSLEDDASRKSRPAIISELWPSISIFIVCRLAWDPIRLTRSSEKTSEGSLTMEGSTFRFAEDPRAL